MDLLSWIIITIWTLKFQLTSSLQCYSCKASGPNEMDANIQCLEKAYLESCDEFYNYYNDVEEELYDYYYNFRGDDEKGGPGGEKDERKKDDTDEPLQNDAVEVELAPSEAGGSVQRRGYPQNAVTRGGKRSSRVKRSSRYTNNSSSASHERNQYRNRKQNNDEEEYEYEYYEDDENSSEPGSKGGRDREKQRDKGRSRGGRGRGGRGRHEKSEEKEEEEVEYEYYEDDEEETTPAPKTVTTSVAVVNTPKKPAKPEHYCYSVTEKTGWETYSVEKGCKKITYCKDALANKPAWAHPWNFCCDRSRCNVKLVKDKPQRVFGMGCRRTDDCIQGHNTRPVCPHFFKSCPRISRSLVKMECRAQSRTMASVKGGLKYRHGKEKKCYCSKGYFPKGPICTSAARCLYSSGLTSSVISLAFLKLLLVVLH